jgi:hypothetical protein
MSISSRTYKAALAGLGVLCFCAAAQMQNRLNAERAQLGLTRLAPLENAPPMLAFTSVALGGFRGLIANALWMRATELQDEDKYFDMVQLADWITTLEPHFAQVWTDQAWNMAYNISVKFKDHEDRWHWVKRGFELLRDRGLPLNPDEPQLYRDLSWIFMHKIGQNLDDAHMRYKLRWAQEMQPLMTGGRPDFEALEHPKTPEEKERARKLRQVYKLDPAIMKKVDDQYGPFDWRLPDAHAVYWAEVFQRHTKPDDPTVDFLRRNIFQALRMDCFRGGALSPLVTNVTERNFMLWPNLDLVPKINAAYEKMISESPSNNFQNAHKNFLKEAVTLLYENGRVRQATYWFDYLKKTYANAFVGRQANISLEDYVIATETEDISETDMNRVNNSLAGLALREFQCQLQDNDDQAENYELMARRVWGAYNKKIGPVSDVRLKLFPWPDIKKRVLDELLAPKSPWIGPYDQAILRTKNNLPAPTAAAPPPPAAPAQ